MTTPLQEFLAPGTALLPGYTVISLLSRGNRLDVYDAWSAKRRCRCIVKLARPDSSHEPAVRERLLAEGDLLSRLDHPHWVRLYEVVATPRTALVLETLTGATLAAVLDRTRRLRAADAVILGAQVASGLSYLHNHGWLHLDLTPGNIVVADHRAILIDLSLAAPPGRGRIGAGTTGYRAPEQLRGQTLTTATDVWALGMVLHEALSGVKPSETDRLNDIAPLRRRQRLRALPDELVELVNTCLADDPADRPTLDAFLVELVQQQAQPRRPRG
jgi:serine/threonine protein kinase